MRSSRFLVSGIMALAIAVSAHAGLIIDPTFDSTIKNDPNAGVIETTIQSAIAAFETRFSESHHESRIYFQEGDGLGESNYFVYEQPYTTFYAGLVANDANPTAIADLTANGGASVNNPVTGNPVIELKSWLTHALWESTSGPGCQPYGQRRFVQHCGRVGRPDLPMMGSSR